jgi:hypothetical protein
MRARKGQKGPKRAKQGQKGPRRAKRPNRAKKILNLLECFSLETASEWEATK